MDTDNPFGLPDTIEYDDFEEPEEIPEKPRRGRPPGRKNRPKDEIANSERLRKLYGRIEPILDAPHKKYLKQVIDGKQSIDPLREAELMLRYASILFTEAAEWTLSEQKMDKTFPDMLNAYRMAIKDLFDMQNKRADEKKKEHGAGLVDATRKSEVDIFENLHRVDTPEGAPV